MLLSSKRVNKRKERMTSLPLSPEVSPVVISYATSFLHCATLCLGLFCALPIFDYFSQYELNPKLYPSL